MTQENKKPKWDGRSRVANELYRKNFKKIFGEEAPEEDPDDLPADPDNHDYE